MNRISFLRCLPFLAAFSLVATTAPAVCAAEDVGRQMEQEYGVVRDSYGEGRRLNEQLGRVSERIVRGVNSQPGRAGFQLRSATILGGRDDKHDKVVNAFALPDGRIYVTLGLLRAIQDSSRSDDELAFVVGHEVTHVVEKHSKAQQSKALQAGLLGILATAVTRSNAVGQIAGVAGNAYVSSYSRKDEYRADRGGLIAMDAAGYDPESAVTMLNRLKSKGEEDNRMMNGWFGSHPLTGNRVKRIQEMIADLHNGREPSATADDSRNDSRNDRGRSRNDNRDRNDDRYRDGR
jgi:predicted Zn-dependent protease